MNPFEEDEESWPDEPDEFDPDSLGPEPPDATLSADTLGSAADVPDGLFRAFWASVLFLNVAIGALSIGAMLIYFQGDYETGVPALVIGLAAALAAARYYRDGTTGRHTESGSDDGATDGETTDGDGDTAESNVEADR